MGVGKEFSKFVLDSVFPRSVKGDTGELYVDLHNHFSSDSFYYNPDVFSIFEKLKGRMDIVGVCERDAQDTTTMKYSHLKKLFKESKYDVVDKGLFFKVTDEDGNFIYFVKSQEIPVEGHHIVVIGSKNDFHKSHVFNDLVDVTKKDNSLLVFAHPFTIGKPDKEHEFIPFRLGKKEDLHELLRVAKHCDLIEAFNAHNILWMITSNVRAKNFSKSYHIPMIASSDSHFELSEVGRSGTFIHSSLIDDSSEKKFLKTLGIALKSGSHRLNTNYVTPYGFYKSIFRKHHSAYHSLKKNKLSNI